MKWLINFIIFFIVGGYILKNLAKLGRRSSSEEKKVEGYTADEDEIRRFLERIGGVKEEPAELVQDEEVEPVKDIFSRQFKEEPTTIGEESVDFHKVLEKEGEPPEVVTPSEHLSRLSFVKRLSSEELRQGIVYSIILGPPRARHLYRPYQF